ncbi:hypothetical protein [Desulfogranum marinum]|jgi:hypothetical protein|uniref:hypothetical protein n=1 Tax=Desulfogranum marinum TaxID=453220 RepID=UPI001963969C|nr:hypothetical protein [Desulfogranum marinum]MBM9515162.1 hypothetical protein [Desulfogranum marinum]
MSGDEPSLGCVAGWKQQMILFSFQPPDSNYSRAFSMAILNRVEEKGRQQAVQDFPGVLK